MAALAAYVASLGPGPAIPDEADYSLEGLTEEEREEAVVRGGQIFLTNCTACHNFDGSGGAMPEGGYAPQIRGVEPKYIYEAMLTGPQNMPNFSNGNLSPDEKRDVIAYLGSLEDTPEYGGFGMGGIGPVSEGMFAWLVGIGAWSASPCGSPPTPHARRRRRSRHDRQPRQPPRGELVPLRDLGADRQPRSPGPRLAADRRRPQGREAGRAAGVVPVPPLDGLRRAVRRRLLLARDRRRPRHVPRAGRLERRARREPGSCPAADRHRRDPVGAQADVRPGDRRVPPPRRLVRRGPRRDAGGTLRSASRSPASADDPWFATRSWARSPCSAYPSS